jgi:isoleucyl-tRNA synthetase
MPAAQWGYPHQQGSAEAFQFPADFIAEAIDQTRGWFYSLLAVNTLVHGSTPYRHVLCLGHIVDDEGRKMSKSLGNVIDPWEILDTRGADALRWWMFSQGSPWTPSRTSLGAIDASMRDMPVTLWNTYSFFMTYASLNGYQAASAPNRAERPEIDRWILSRLEQTTTSVTNALDSYEPLEAASAVGSLVDDLSNWYVRLSRRRFWRTDPSAPASDSLAAHATLHEVLLGLSVLLAPMCPFLSDHMFVGLMEDPDDASVHLCDWPEGESTSRDEDLEARMAVAREIVSLGRAARAEAGLKVRQPLRRALVFLPSGSALPPAGVVEGELNVDRVEFSTELTEVLSYEVHPNFKSVGPKLGERAQALRPALKALDAPAVAQALEQGESVTVSIDGADFQLTDEDLELRVQAQPGFAISRAGAEVVALDLELDDDLLRRGALRELVRQIQELRKDRGLDVADHISLSVVGIALTHDEVEMIRREVLADAVGDRPGAGDELTVDLADGLTVSVWISLAE